MTVTGPFWLLLLPLLLPLLLWWCKQTESGLEIVESDDRRLVVRQGLQTIVLDKRYKSVKRREKVLTLFDRIQHIEIRHLRTRESRPQDDSWIVSLRIGPLSTVRIGASSDEEEASIVGAHLATLTGKPVIAV